MIKKIKFLNKAIKTYEAVEAFLEGNEDKIKKYKDIILEVIKYVEKAKAIIDKIKG